MRIDTYLSAFSLFQIGQDPINIPMISGINLFDLVLKPLVQVALNGFEQVMCEKPFT